MINLNLTEAQLDELHQEASDNPDSRARRKGWIVYLRGKGHACQEIVDRMRVDGNTVTEYLRKYGAGGLAQLLAEDYRRPGGGLDSPAEQLKALFGKQPPHTVNHAIERIEQETGLRLQPSAGRELLHKLGLKPRCCGWVPGKALEDGAQQRAPQEFHDRTRQPMLEEAQRGQRVIRFVATAHFVMGAFLGILGCLVRQWLLSSSGRRRDNVLGADDPIRHEVITLTNDTVVNPETFCALRDKIATAYAGTGHPITRVLDNAHYPKCPAVFAKAQALGIKLLYVPAYSPNLNLSERFWRFVKKQVLTVPTTARSPPSRKASTVVCATSAPASNARCKH